MMMINLEMDSFVLHQQSNRGIMDDVLLVKKPAGADDAVCSPSSSEVSSVVSSGDDSDLFEEEVNSPTSDSSASASSSGDNIQLAASQFSSGPLQDMSSLLQELPIKRGLSRHYNGKSQSFTSLANVTSLEDLAKPENPYNKKLKSCRSYGGLFESHGSTSIHHKGSSSRLISKKTARGSCSSLCVKRNSSFLGSRPPIPPPHRSASTTNFTSQRPLFALGI
ncbi:OLC1v1010339C1 [Oldenlandia corymbosa var. corymbosa]|uniref:OLC1v1010339C1 n=1 Tax=Oldenlandia corymbosa var. corymbosa TaxID=529605 RepID=A0AAV1DR30_OLDCO|nr:OLC1v1010339C1 [Oldenlandia corymbosa var. corymbosa]